MQVPASFEPCPSLSSELSSVAAPNRSEPDGLSWPQHPSLSTAAAFLAMPTKTSTCRRTICIGFEIRGFFCTSFACEHVRVCVCVTCVCVGFRELSCFFAKIQHETLLKMMMRTMLGWRLLHRCCIHFLVGIEKYREQLRPYETTTGLCNSSIVHTSIHIH